MYVSCIQHYILTLCTLPHAHHQKFSFYLSPYIWPPLPISPFPNLPTLLVTSTLFSVSMCSFCVLFVCLLIFHIFIQYLSFFICIISHSIIPSRSIHVVTSGKISYFLWLTIIPLYINTISSLFIHQWAFRLFP